MKYTVLKLYFDLYTPYSHTYPIVNGCICRRTYNEFIGSYHEGMSQNHSSALSCEVYAYYGKTWMNCRRYQIWTSLYENLKNEFESVLFPSDAESSMRYTYVLPGIVSAVPSDEKHKPWSFLCDRLLHVLVINAV